MTTPAKHDGIEDQHILNGPRVVTDADVMGIVKLVDDRLGAWSGLITEHMGTLRDLLVAKLDGNTEAARLRWELHESETSREHSALRTDLINVTVRVGTVEGKVDGHLKAEHDEDVAQQARVRPVKTVLQTVRAYWSQIAFVALVIWNLTGHQI